VSAVCGWRLRRRTAQLTPPRVPSWPGGGRLHAWCRGPHGVQRPCNRVGPVAHDVGVAWDTRRIHPL
jgi:hypothetical protein